MFVFLGYNSKLDLYLHWTKLYRFKINKMLKKFVYKNSSQPKYYISSIIIIWRYKSVQNNSLFVTVSIHPYIQISFRKCIVHQSDAFPIPHAISLTLSFDCFQRRPIFAIILRRSLLALVIAKTWRKCGVSIAELFAIGNTLWHRLIHRFRQQ